MEMPRERENILESPVKRLGLIGAFPLTALKETLSTKKQIWVSIYCILSFYLLYSGVFFTSTGCLFCLAAMEQFPREIAGVGMLSSLSYLKRYRLGYLKSIQQQFAAPEMRLDTSWSALNNPVL